VGHPAPTSSDLLAQTLVLAQQPHMALNFPLQSVKAEVYDRLARKLSFSLSQKNFNQLKASLLPNNKKWDYQYNDENHDTTDMDR
jgi:hypothetical protein